MVEERDIMSAGFLAISMLSLLYTRIPYEIPSGEAFDIIKIYGILVFNSVDLMILLIRIIIIICGKKALFRISLVSCCRKFPIF